MNQITGSCVGRSPVSVICQVWLFLMRRFTVRSLANKPDYCLPSESDGMISAKVTSAVSGGL